MHCLYFICERKFYGRTHIKITRHWKSTLRVSDRGENINDSYIFDLLSHVIAKRGNSSEEIAGR